MSENKNNLQIEDDKKLKEKVEKAINNEKDFSGYDINVRVLDGRVILSGIVDVLAEKNHAQNVVKSIEGVKEIENNLTIATDGAIYDGHIHMEVRQEIDGDPRLNSASIKISLKKGTVILEGATTTLAQKKAAEKAAEKARGVVNIINKIKVKSKDNLEDASIVNEIRRVFRTEGIGDRLEVTSKDGSVTIKGVASQEEKDRAIKLASKVPGVSKVNTSSIDTRKGELDRAAAVAEKVKNHFSKDKTLEDLPIEIYEEEGHLVLDGFVEDITQKRIVDKALHSLMEEYGQDLIAVENKIRLKN